MSEFPVVSTTTLANALALRSQSLSSGATGGPFIKLIQTGAWIYGADDLEVQEGSQWAVNPHSFSEGFIAWGVGEVIDERMALMTSTQPIVKSDLPEVPKAEKGWQKQVGFIMVCLTGDDKGVQVSFKTSSAGGVKGVTSLIEAVVGQLGVDESKIQPVVILEESHYVHKDWDRKIYNPVFSVQSWMSVDSTEAPVTEIARLAPAEPEKASSASSAVRKRRRPAAKA